MCLFLHSFLLFKSISSSYSSYSSLSFPFADALEIKEGGYCFLEKKYLKINKNICLYCY